MNLSDPPLLVQLLPEPHLRVLVIKWKLQKYFSGKRGDSYVDWLRGEVPSLAKLYGYAPSLGQLRNSVAASIATENRFLDYLIKEDGAMVLGDKERLEDLATAGAAVLLTYYTESASDDT